ncbi:MAG: c-type cytochrome [Chthoniobacterales bacterium]
MLRYFFIGFSLLVLLLVSMTGLRGWKSKRPPIELFPDMVRQAKYKPQTESDFYADDRSARQHVDGTVPLGYAPPQGNSSSSHDVMSDLGPYENIQFSASPDYVATGRMGNQWGTGIPFEVTAAIMKRGRERYNISCAVCHGATGVGNGIASKYGLNGIANQQQQRIRDMADGEIFNTITWGKNTMMGYGSTIQVPDRWAIIAYLRSLQRSQHATLSDVPEEEQKNAQGWK